MLKGGGGTLEEMPETGNAINERVQVLYSTCTVQVPRTYVLSRFRGRPHTGAWKRRGGDPVLEGQSGRKRGRRMDRGDTWERGRRDGERGMQACRPGEGLRGRQ